MYSYNIDNLKRIAITSNVNHKHAAALLYNKTDIVTYAINKYIKKGIYFKTIHAEINLLHKIKNTKFSGLDIIVIRVNENSNKLLNSRPCNNCIDILKSKGIRKVHYSTSDGNIVIEYVQNMDKLHVSSWNRNML